MAKLVDERHAAWEADLPLGDDAALWDYLTVLDQGSRLALLAHCLSFGINALHEKVNPYGAGISASGLTRRMAQADLVARAVDLDMVEAGWEPTVDGYLNRVPKARILEAVREAIHHSLRPRRGARRSPDLHQTVRRATAGPTWRYFSILGSSILLIRFMNSKPSMARSAARPCSRYPHPLGVDDRDVGFSPEG